MTGLRKTKGRLGLLKKKQCGLATKLTDVQSERKRGHDDDEEEEEGRAAEMSNYFNLTQDGFPLCD